MKMNTTYEKLGIAGLIVAASLASPANGDLLDDIKKIFQPKHKIERSISAKEALDRIRAIQKRSYVVPSNRIERIPSGYVERNDSGNIIRGAGMVGFIPQHAQPKLLQEMAQKYNSINTQDLDDITQAKRAYHRGE